MYYFFTHGKNFLYEISSKGIIVKKKKNVKCENVEIDEKLSKSVWSSINQR